ncbi:hypothetical protein [Thermovibrio sp.]
MLTGELEVQVRWDGGRKIKLSEAVQVEEVASKLFEKYGEEKENFFKCEEVSEEFGRELLHGLLNRASALLPGYRFYFEEEGEELKIVCTSHKGRFEVIAKKGYPKTVFRALNAHGVRGILTALDSVLEKVERFLREPGCC